MNKGGFSGQRNVSFFPFENPGGHTIAAQPNLPVPDFASFVCVVPRGNRSIRRLPRREQYTGELTMSFSGAVTIIHDSQFLSVTTGANFTATPGDIVKAYPVENGKWVIVPFLKQAGYRTKSSTSKAIASSGSQSITVEAGLLYDTNCRVRMTSRSSGAFMEGLVTSYSGKTLVFTAEGSDGSGTLDDWSVDLPGLIDAQGWYTWSAPSAGGYGPVLTALAGTLSDTDNLIVKYRVERDMCHMNAMGGIAVGGNGTGSGELLMTVPIGSVNGDTMDWMLLGTGQQSGFATVFATHADLFPSIVRVTKADGSYPGGDNSSFSVIGNFRCR